MLRAAPVDRLPPAVLAALTAAGLLLAAAPPAAARPSGSTTASATPSATAARPTVDLAAPTPTAPPVGGPARGSAPDGSTVGGERLGTRGLVVADGAPPLPDGVTAAGWLVADAGSGAVLAARDPHGRYYPASTLKTLTLLAVAHAVPPDLVVEGTAEDENVEGSRVGIVRGGRYPVALLFRALVLQSGNDAANALARAAGGIPATVAAMNATARRIGAYDTVAGTPSGLDVAGQSSSPYDLALIFRQLVADPGTAAVLTTRTAEMPAAGGRPGFQIQSQNPLLMTFPGDLGGKPGFTDAARHTFVTAAERDGRRLVVTLMQTERRPVTEYEQATRLLDWGFAVPAGTAGVGRLVDPGEVGTATASPIPTGHAAAAGPTAAAPAAASAHLRPGPVAVGAGVLLLAVLGTAVTVRRRVTRRESRPRPSAATRSTRR